MINEIILFGSTAKKAVHSIIDSSKQGKHPLLKGTTGMFQEDDHVTAFDNRSDDCWVENFKNARDALAWIRR